MSEIKIDRNIAALIMGALDICFSESSIGLTSETKMNWKEIRETEEKLVKELLVDFRDIVELYQYHPSVKSVLEKSKL